MYKLVEKMRIKLLIQIINTGLTKKGRNREILSFTWLLTRIKLVDSVLQIKEQKLPVNNCWKHIVLKEA